jgi:hypothetical protein
MRKWTTDPSGVLILRRDVKRSQAEATAAVQGVHDRLEAIEERHGPVPLTGRQPKPA